MCSLKLKILFCFFKKKQPEGAFSFCTDTEQEATAREVCLGQHRDELPLQPSPSLFR